MPISNAKVGMKLNLLEYL